MATTSPKNITIRGRVSFPRWTYKEALAANPNSKFPKKDEDVAPEFNLLVDQAQLDKFVDHLLNVFLPYCEDQFKKGEKKDALDPKQAKKVRDLIESGDWEDQPPYIPIKVVHEKTQPMAPDAVASVKISGPKGADIDLQATVWSEDQLLVPDPDILTYPVRKKIGETVFTPYAGAYFVATLNLFAYVGNMPGVSAGANVAFYMGNLEGERFGGGTDVDEDAIFLDD
jgi:hypothetical protein